MDTRDEMLAELAQLLVDKYGNTLPETTDMWADEYVAYILELAKAGKYKGYRG